MTLRRPLTGACLLFLLPLAAPALASEHASPPADFNSALAMTALFGNYDPVTKTSSATMPSNSQLSATGFRAGAEITVKPFFSQTALDAGSEKGFFLTYAVPQGKPDDGEMFGCHACAPLIGAALFSRKDGKWIVESSNPSVMLYGQFGGPPEAKLIKIGPARTGIQLNLTYGGQGEFTTTAAILVPWHAGFTKAFWTTLSDRYEDCKFSKLPCYRYTKQMKFVAGKNPDYFDIVLKNSGTDIRHSEPPQRVRVSNVERWRLLNGEYLPGNSSHD